MSGPPPCTTIGLIPTYLSSTTSRANSSRSAGSSIAAPPYLITTVLPWNSRMYGSASRRVPTSRMPGLGRVLGVDGHVAVGEVGEEDLRLVAIPGEADHVLDLLARDARGERLGVVRHGGPPLAHRHALDDDVDRELAQQRVERLAEGELVLGLLLDRHAAAPAAHEEHGVVRRELAVDGDPVERALDRDAEQQVGGLRAERGVGLHEAEHRREARLDHPGALGLGTDR